MDSIERTITVSWRHRVLFTEDVFAPANPALSRILSNGEVMTPTPRVLLALDRSLAEAQPGLAAAAETYFAQHASAIRLVGPPLVCQGGEQAKATGVAVGELHTAINHHHLDRHSYLIAVGGGAFLDLAGYAAATAHRGVRHVRIPSTTLSQCDSGVGVKNGINAFGKKNFLGTFAPPFAVINDFNLLTTLPPREMRAGYVEAVKVACIRDREFFTALEQDAPALVRFEAGPMRRLIRRCGELHVNHIATSGDPFEFGSARPLDFGHWAAHKLEQASNFTLPHGEAVAIGVALDVLYSRRAGFLAADDAERVLGLLEFLGFQLFTSGLLARNARQELLVLEGVEDFREHLGGQLAITLLRGIGMGFEVHEMDAGLIAECVQELHARNKAAK